MLSTFIAICLLVISPTIAADIQPVLYNLGPLPSLTGALEKNGHLTKAERYKLNELVGPVSYAFHRDHIYTGLANGQIVDVSDCGVKVIASLGPARCQGELQCGRPMGLRMDPQGRLIVADAHRGIFRINIETGAVQHLYSSSTPVGGRVSKFISDVVVASDGTILFTDSSGRWNRQEKMSILLEGESTGRLLAYSDKSNQAIVVLKNLSFPNGLQLGPNDDYLLISETGRAKILKLSLNRGDGTWLALTEFASNLPGLPDNIRASGRGTYWVAFSQARHENMTSMIDDYADKLQMRKIIANVYSKDQIRSMTTKYGIVAELDENGNILRTFQDPTGLKVDSVSEAHEHEGYLYLGSVDNPFISRVTTTYQFNVERFLDKLKSTCRATKINVGRLRVVLRRLIAIAELRRSLLAAKRRREEAEEMARMSTTTSAPSVNDSSSEAPTTTTAVVTGVSEGLTSSTGSATVTTQGATGTTATAGVTDSTVEISTQAATTPVSTVAPETTTVDLEAGGGIVDPVTDAPTTAESASTSTASVTEASTTSGATESTAQTATDASTAVATETATESATVTASTDSATIAAATESSTSAASTASQITDGATTASTTDATTGTSDTTASTASTP